MNDQAVQISRDPFARRTLLRQMTGQPGDECAWCGSQRMADGQPARLFQYGSLSDGIFTRAQWAPGAFCSISCARSMEAIP